MTIHHRHEVSDDENEFLPIYEQLEDAFVEPHQDEKNMTKLFKS